MAAVAARVPCDPDGGDGLAEDCRSRAEACATIPHVRQGGIVAQVCPAQARSAGLTIVDLSDQWAPRILAGGVGGPVPYRAEYVRLANEQLGDTDSDRRARHDRFYELFGVFPSFSVVAKRLADAARHRCHDAATDQALEQLAEGVDTWRPLAKQRSDLGRARVLRKRLEGMARRQKLARIDELAGERVAGAWLQVLRRIETRHSAIAAMQRHLRCEGLLPSPFAEGLLDRSTIAALEAYHRRHMIVSWQLDDETRQALLTDSRELDYRTLLRSLRERVVDATGWLEDGSAAGRPGLVLGRSLDSRAFTARAAGGALPESEPAPRGADELVGAEDLIAQGTSAAARALGWTDPAAVRAFFASGPWPERVAIELPQTPGYHGEHMDLRVEIDRGDVWYEFPFSAGGDRLHSRNLRPSLTLYASVGDDDFALVRWPTTVGGWQPERLGNGQVRLLHKESPAGSRLWRDVVAAPRWIPPHSTPVRDLVRPIGQGRWAPKLDTFGPSYASAYGLAMMIHHRPDRRPDGTVLWTDQGIRTHGSVSYASILDGFSHGCHRLHNHRAVRLAGFLLAHRRHVVRGPLELDYHRTIYWRGKRAPLHFASRGFRYELIPPVAVDVTPGRIRGHQKSPLPPRPLTRPMRRRYR